MNLETERLLIRPLEERDYIFIFKLLNSDTWLKYIGDRNIATRDDAKTYINKIINDPSSRCDVFVLKETQEPLGILTLIYRKPYQFPDMGYAMLPEFEKNGYAFEAAKRFFDDLIETGVSKKIIAITSPGNSNSINLLKKLGMVLEKEYQENEKTLLLFSTEK